MEIKEVSIIMSHLLRVTLFLLFFMNSANLIAQELPGNTEFPIGAFIASKNTDIRHGSDAWNSVDSSGMNTFIQYADNITQGYLENYNAIGLNNDFPQDKIYWYALGYYSIWEAENPGDISRTGFVHNAGNSANWRGVNCWTNSTTAPACSLLYGPHYKQDKDWKDFNDRVDYTARYWLALDFDSASVDPNTEICKLIITERYTKIINESWDGHVYVDKIDSLILKASDFYGSSGNFKKFQIEYRYPTKFEDKALEKTNNIPADTVYSDIDPDNGIEFKLDFLGTNGNNHIRNLYADNVEVFDNLIWTAYMDNPDSVSNQIINYALPFKNSSNWDNMKYWYATDEPRSIDNFLPMHIVDSILNSVQCPHLITEIYPPWNTKLNGDTLLRKYVEIAQPHTLMIDSYPIWPPEEGTVQEGLENLRNKLQVAHSVQPDFWYVGQGFGEQDPQDSTVWYVWRKPNPPELKASVMLALAHGIKGLLFWNYWTYPGHQPLCNCDVIHNGLVTDEQQPKPTELWYLIKNNLAPRLEGRLGNRLLGLKYTGDYISARYSGDPNYPYPQTVDYLTLPTPYTTQNWHAGLLYRNGFNDNKYFFLANLIPDTAKSIPIGLTPFDPNFVNYRFRNYEGGFDTTFSTSFSYTLTHPAGEGYLYEVAPVVKYGGKLYTNETINTHQYLYDDMTIENGKTLTVNETYDCYANIYTKGTGKIQTVNGGTINFYNGKGIIAQGSPNIIGTSSHKLTIDFGSATTGTGIQLLQGANAVISYCILKNSVNLITAENSQFKTSVNHCDFQNTSSYAISLAGTSTQTPGVTYCTFINTDNGIFAAGQNSFTINENTFTDNKLAISLSQIASVQIIHNEFSSDLETLPGILLSSCGGNVRKNTITGHSYGISLANSSPLIGDNYIYGNRINGIYVGAGSVPDLRGALVGLPNNRYPISGYNDIENNGGYTSPPDTNDDGSEIYFGHSSIQLNNGCNLIADDRTVSPPLETTLYLMNGEVTTDRLYATYNAWGDTVYPARFGDLSVTYIPYNHTICDIPGSGSMLVMQDNDGNTLDTVYSAGPPDYTPTATDVQYAQALEYMINRDYSSADEIYSSIISSAPGDITSEDAYLGLYKSARLQNLDSLELAALREMFNANIENITDSVMLKVVSQLSLLTLVDEKQYNNAINGFGDIIIQNPETEEALFAEIDAMTTSLLAGNGNDTTLNKGLNKNLLVKGTQDFQDRLNKLIQKRFGAEAKSKDKDIIPTEYSLYYNYPNPFNPATIIRFDIPERTQVELVVYDILGRRVKSLINNEFRNPGRYEVSFNASSLASGVYIYKLTTQNYSQARKMLLVK